MMHRDAKSAPAPLRSDDGEWDLDALLHPAQAFEHPNDVVNDPDLTLNEKRAILASWASDACAVEAAPALRLPPAGGRPVRFDDIMDALRELDREAEQRNDRTPRYKRVLRRARLFESRRRRGSSEGEHGPALN
jgi:hypothetical protein